MKDLLLILMVVGFGCEEKKTEYEYIRPMFLELTQKHQYIQVEASLFINVDKDSALYYLGKLKQSAETITYLYNKMYKK